jgi:DNA-damage-inducible protein J
MYCKCIDNVNTIKGTFKMANSTTIQTRIDPKVKKQAKKILDTLGLTMSEAIGAYLRQIILHKGIPFKLKIPNEATIKAVEQIEAGKGKTFKNADDFFKDLEN